MRRGKHVKKNSINYKFVGLVFALLTLSLIATNGTVAFLVDKTESLPNTFEPAEVKVLVTESFDFYELDQVRIKNTGNIDAYVRAAVVTNWRDADGNIYGQQPIAGVHYSIQYNLNTGGWMRNPQDGYYYLAYPLPPNVTASALILTCTPVESKTPEGCKLSVEIIPQAIQSEPLSVIQTHWNVPMNGIYINISGIGVTTNDTTPEAYRFN